jgi:hypothetical protein
MRNGAYLEWTNSPRPSDRGEDRDACSRATTPEHRKRRQGRNLGTDQFPPGASNPGEGHKLTTLL